MPKVIRFGLGHANGLRSSSFRVWTESDSSVYVVNRHIGRHLKISLHPQEFGYGYTEVFEATHGRVEGGRKIQVWPSETNRLGEGPLKEAFAIILGRFSMGLPPTPSSTEDVARAKENSKHVQWLTDMPPLDHAWQFTVLISDPGVRTSPPGTRALGAIPVGELVMTNGGSVWVMRHQIPVTEGMKGNLAKVAGGAVEGLGKPEDHALYKAQVVTVEPTGLRALWDLAVTIKADRNTFNTELQRAGILDNI